MFGFGRVRRNGAFFRVEAPPEEALEAPEEALYSRTYSKSGPSAQRLMVWGEAVRDKVARRRPRGPVSRLFSSDSCAFEVL
jgi:hypothetical protein